MTKTFKETDIQPLTSPNYSLETLRTGCYLKAPNFQRTSINSTIVRINNRSSKKFSCHKVPDTNYFTIKRIR